VNVRAITPDDAEAVAAIARADEVVLRGHTHIESGDVLDWWSRGDLRDSWLFEEDGAPVAAGWFARWGDKGTFAGVVAQGAKGRGFGAEIAERAEALGRARDVNRMHTYVLLEDEAAASLFTGRGYSAVRRFYEMAIELDEEPVVPALDPPLVLDAFHEEDARAFHAASNDSFQDHWDWHGLPFDEWWELRRTQDHSLWFLVRDGDEIAAIARNEPREASGHVGLLGVRRAWRGRGLGKALLYRTFAEFWRRGLPRITLGVDAESPTGATKLYERVGMHVENTTVVYER
jgi:mycothiol synthase